MLPPEIILDIALRLPVKSIGRFRCVSKPWRFILTQPQFIKYHLHRNKQYPAQQSLLLLFFSHCYSAPFSNAHQLFDEITASPINLSYEINPCWNDSGIPYCDGLMLLQNYATKRVLVNPTTGVFKELPISPFGLDPRSSSTLYGLGYDSVSDDYKVVTLSYYDTDFEDESGCVKTFVNVYSVNYGTWKKVESSPYNHAGGHGASGVYVSGCIHWLATRTEDDSPVIVAFDLTQEKFREVPPPGSANENVLKVPPLSSLGEASDEIVKHSLVVLGGCLCVFTAVDAMDVNIWMMKEYGVEKSWTLVTINVNDEVLEYRPVRPLCMWGKEEEMMVKNGFSWRGKLVKYNLKEETFKDIMIHGITGVFKFGVAYIETLVSPFGSLEPERG